jgi:flagellar motility protein MotE (MotC chaperone)
VRYMSQKQEVPEVVLSDIVADLVGKRRYLSYTDPEEWEPFFQSMSSIIQQIISKSDRLQTEAKILREREDQRKLEAGEDVLKFKREKEANAKLQVDCNKLETECRGLRGVDTNYQELKKYTAAMKKELDARARELGEIKPSYQRYQEENTRLTKQVDTLNARC